jgi:hypothetical protein
VWQGVDGVIKLCGIKGKGVDIRGYIDDLVTIAVKTTVGIGIVGSVGAADAGASATGAASTVTVIVC